MRHGIASLFTLILVTSPVVAYGQTVTAMWDPSPPSDQVTSYQACIGTTSKSCNVQLASVSNAQTAYIFTPTPGVVHYVAIKATNLVGTSSYSTEASFSIPSFTQPVNQSSPVGVAYASLRDVAASGGTLLGDVARQTVAATVHWEDGQHPARPAA